MNQTAEHSLPSDPYCRPFEGSAEHRALYEYQLSLDCTVPLLIRWGIDPDGLWVMDLGCGSGGLVLALAAQGAHCLGVDLRPERIQAGREMAAQQQVEVDLRTGDILRMGALERRYDLVILSEIVEHLETAAYVLELLMWCREQLSPKGRIYVSFPPWFSPFAGHQAGWEVIRYIPWYHLLPDRLKKLLAPGHALAYLEFAQELNHLTIHTFEKIAKQAGLEPVSRELYLIRPEYRYRYGIPELRSSPLARIPVIREFVAMGAYYLLGQLRDGVARAK
jgi:2-polyprenyl-3-methyl-5-hydroxy-6-metoxy-1,4-benzoquinol methylase